MKLFDAHLHFFSYDFFISLARLVAQRTGEAPEGLLTRAAEKAGFDLPPRDPIEHLQRWLAAMDRHGVDRAAAFASLPEEAEPLRDACADADDRLIPLTMVNPLSQNGAAFARQALTEMGFRGILLFPSLHHFDLLDDACRPILEIARDCRAVVLVHCGILEIKVRDLLGLPRPYNIRYANPLAVTGAASRYPEVTFIIPHFGAGLFQETLLAGAQCPNIYVDTSSSNGWMKLRPDSIDLDRVLEMALGTFGPERILFGTDSTTFPRGWRSDVYSAQSAALERLGVSIPDRNLIFGENLARILNLRV